MAFAAPAIIAGIGALGGLFGNRKSIQQTTQNSRFNNRSVSNIGNQSEYARYGQNHIELDPLARQGYNTLAGKYQQMLGQDPDLKGYLANQVGTINRQTDQNQLALQGNLASKGITGPAAEMAMLGGRDNAFAQKIQLQNQIPMLARKMQTDLMGQAGEFYKGIPTDTYTTETGTANSQTHGEDNQWGESSSTGTQTNPGNMLGGTFGSLGQILAFLYGNGAFGGEGGGGSTQNFNTGRARG